LADRFLDKASDRKGNQATAALPAGAAADVPNEAKSETAVATANKPAPSKTINASKTCDMDGGVTAPDALGDKYADSAPTSCKAESRAQGTAPAEVVADFKPCKDPASALPLPQETPCQPRLLPENLPLSTPRQPSLLPGGFPLQTPHQSHLFLRRTPPEKYATVTKERTSTPESAASASAKPNSESETPNVPGAKNAGELPAQTEASSATAQDSGVKPDGAVTEPRFRPSQHSEAGGWGSAITKGGDANPKGPVKPLRLDYIREVSTASTMSATGPGIPVDEVPSSSFEEEDGDASGARLTTAQKKRMRERARKQALNGEKNSPRPPSGASTSNSVANSVVQEPKPVATASVDTYSYRGGRRCPCGCEGESGEDDAPVIVEKPDATMAVTAADDAADDDKWGWWTFALTSDLIRIDTIYYARASGFGFFALLRYSLFLWVVRQHLFSGLRSRQLPYLNVLNPHPFTCWKLASLRNSREVG